jgi:hypothetical protein
VEILIGGGVAVVGSLAVADVVPPVRALEAGMMALPAFLLVFAASALYEFGGLDSTARWGLTAAGLAGTGGYGALVLDPGLLAEVWRWGFLSGGLALGVMMLPWVANPFPDLRRPLAAWHSNVRMGLRALAAALYTSFLGLGIVLGLLAFEGLFEVGVDRDVYGHVLLWVYAVGGVWIVATGLPRLADGAAEGVEQHARFVYWAASLLVLPLLGLYLLILYGYGGKVLVTGAAPRNLLSPLALGAALLGLVTLFLIEPLRSSDERTWLVRLLDAVPLAYLPLLPMPTWAIWVRIQQYGWTEFRYLRLLAVGGTALCFGWAAWRVGRGRAYSATVLPAVFALLLLFGAFGPSGALSVAKTSQLARLQSHLSDIESGSETGTPAFRADVRSRVRYLARHFGMRALDPVLGTDAPRPESVEAALTVLGLPEPEPDRRGLARLQYQGPIPLEGAGMLHPVATGRPDNAGAYRLVAEGLSIVVMGPDSARVSLSLADRLPALLAHRDDTGPQDDVPRSQLTFEAVSDAGERYRLVLRGLVLGRSAATEPAAWRVEHADGLLVVRAAE